MDSQHQPRENVSGARLRTTLRAESARRNEFTRALLNLLVCSLVLLGLPVVEASSQQLEPSMAERAGRVATLLIDGKFDEAQKHLSAWALKHPEDESII